jgi:hypothetical protein
LLKPGDQLSKQKASDDCSCDSASTVRHGDEYKLNENHGSHTVAYPSSSPRHVNEDPPDQRVNQRPSVERPHEPLAIRPILDITNHRHVIHPASGEPTATRRHHALPRGRFRRVPPASCVGVSR